MTQTDVGCGAQQVIVNAPIDRAFDGVHRTVRRLQATGAQPARARRLPRPCSKPRVGWQHRRPGGRRQRVPMGTDPGLRTAGPGRVQLGHQPAVGDRDRPRTDQRGRGPVLHRRRPGGPGVELEHRHIDRHGPGWQAVTDGVDGDEGWPLYLARYAALFGPGLTAEPNACLARRPAAAYLLIV